MIERMTRVTDVVDLLNKVSFVQYNNGWSSTSLAKDAVREITRLRQLLSEAETREKRLGEVAVNAEKYGYDHGIAAARREIDKLLNVDDTAEYQQGIIDAAAAVSALQSEER